MKNHRFIGWLVACGAALGGCSSPGAEDRDRAGDPPAREAPRAPAPFAPAALTAAHEAYLNGDFLGLGERIRDVLLDPGAGDAARQNAYELLDKAYEAQGGALPSAFKPPPGYRSLQYVIFHNAAPSGPSYQVHFRLLTRDPSHVVGLTLRRLPDETLLDKATGKGRFRIRHDPGTQKAGLEEIVLDSGPVAAPPADGVISLRLELDDGTVSEGFFIARGLASTATPTVRSPAPWASVSDPNPRVTWAPFRSPESAPFEKRSLGIQVARDREDALAWELWSNKPDEIEETRLGSSAGVGRSALAPGSYRLNVVGSERRTFGPVDLIRGSRTVQPFRVTP